MHFILTYTINVVNILALGTLGNPECEMWDPRTNLLVRNGCPERIIDSEVRSFAPQATNFGAISLNMKSEIYLFYQCLGSGIFSFFIN
jgi:hypothetical protein